jgi:hypothetical protein
MAWRGRAQAISREKPRNTRNTRKKDKKDGKKRKEKEGRRTSG